MRRHPPEVYRRRRVTVLGLAVLVLALFIVGIVLLVQALSGDGDQQATTQQEQPGAEAGKPRSEQEAQAPGPEGDEASGMCPDDQVTVAASTDKKEYQPGAKAAMTLEVKNEHTAECKIEVGSAAQQFIIEQDDKPVWNSSWCSTDGQNTQQVFAPGATKKSTLSWNLVPTDKNCNKTADQFEPGDYQLVVKLGDVTSQPQPFKVLDDGKSDKKDDKSGDSKKKSDKSDSKKSSKSSDSSKSSTKDSDS